MSLGFQQFPINTTNNNQGDSGLSTVIGVEKSKSIDGGETTVTVGVRPVPGAPAVAGDEEKVTLMLTVHCTFLSATVTRTVKVASALFGGSDINHSQSMRRSMANPGNTAPSLI